MGDREVFTSCDGWLMVSQSSTTSCILRANSKIRSISDWTSTEKSNTLCYSIKYYDTLSFMIKCQIKMTCNDLLFNSYNRLAKAIIQLYSNYLIISYVTTVTITIISNI